MMPTVVPYMNGDCRHRSYSTSSVPPACYSNNMPTKSSTLLFMKIGHSFLLIFLGILVSGLLVWLWSLFCSSHTSDTWFCRRKTLSSFVLIPDDENSIPTNLNLGEMHYHLAQKRKKEREKRIAEKKSVEEALSSIRLAYIMKTKGKPEKALRLVEHAYNMFPTNPEILTSYGEYLEKHEKDVILAEHLYSRALILSPGHQRASENRKRALPLVEDIDSRLLQRLDQKKDHIATIPDSHPGLKRAKWESYFQHIYHTNAIEGNTFSLGQTRAVLETRIAIGGKSIIEHNEILGMDSAMRYINKTLVSGGPTGTGGFRHISLNDILEIHRRVLGNVDPLEAGAFRNTQVFVGDFVPPRPSKVYPLMQDLIHWLNHPRSLELHPVEFAALAHYKLVVIHPFYDGNGRTSRLLMNLILMRNGYPPTLIPVQRKHEYYQHLQTANDGDVRPFIRFIADCTDQTLNHYLLATSTTEQLHKYTRAEISGDFEMKDESDKLSLSNINDDHVQTSSKYYSSLHPSDHNNPDDLQSEGEPKMTIDSSNNSPKRNIHPDENFSQLNYGHALSTSFDEYSGLTTITTTSSQPCACPSMKEVSHKNYYSTCDGSLNRLFYLILNQFLCGRRHLLTHRRHQLTADSASVYDAASPLRDTSSVQKRKQSLPVRKDDFYVKQEDSDNKKFVNSHFDDTLEHIELILETESSDIGDGGKSEFHSDLNNDDYFNENANNRRKVLRSKTPDSKPFYYSSPFVDDDASDNVEDSNDNENNNKKVFGDEYGQTANIYTTGPRHRRTI